MPKPTENPVEEAPLALGDGAGVPVVLPDSAPEEGAGAMLAEGVGAMEGAAEEAFLTLISTC